MQKCHLSLPHKQCCVLRRPVLCEPRRGGQRGQIYCQRCSVTTCFTAAKSSVVSTVSTVRLHPIHGSVCVPEPCSEPGDSVGPCSQEKYETRFVNSQLKVVGVTGESGSDMRVLWPVICLETDDQRGGLWAIHSLEIYSTWPKH